MITIKVNGIKALELTNQYLDTMAECGISRPSGEKITAEEPIAKIAACLNVASIIAVGITGGSDSEIGMLHEALSTIVDKYLKLVGFDYKAEEVEDHGQ